MARGQLHDSPDQPVLVAQIETELFHRLADDFGDALLLKPSQHHGLAEVEERRLRIPRVPIQRAAAGEDEPARALLRRSAKRFEQLARRRTPSVECQKLVDLVEKPERSLSRMTGPKIAGESLKRDRIVARRHLDMFAD